jgi:putative ABC transport system permease protein
MLPRGFRDIHGAAMEDVFVDAHDAASRRGRIAVWRLWLRETWDLARTGRRLRTDVRRLGAGFVTRGVARRWTRRGGGRTMGLADDFSYAVRSLVRRPSLTAFAMLMIALGVGATTAMFSTVESVVLDPLPFENGDRMVGLYSRMGEDASVFVTPGAEDLELWAEQTDIFEVVEPWAGRAYTLTGRGEPVELNAALIRPSYHDFIGLVPAYGRTFDEDELVGEGREVVLLAYGSAERIFGLPADALGESLTLDGEPWTVVGVMPRGTLAPGWGLRSVEVWAPLSNEMASGTTQAVALLREGVTAEQANDRFAELAEADATSRSRGYASLVKEQVGRPVEGYLGLLMGAVVLLLLIACVNVSNLLLFRADARKRETAVRAALGGGRARLTRQLLIESVVLALGGGVVGIGFAHVGQNAILRLRPDQLEVLDFISIDGTVLAFALAVTLTAGILFGLLPAIQASRPDALSPLRSGVRSEGDVIGGRLRWLLVAGEVALSFALLIGSLTVLSTLMERQSIDFGYAVDEVIAMRTTAPSWKYPTSDERRAFYDGLVERIGELPGVAYVTHASGAPPRAGVWFGTFEVDGRGELDGNQILYGPAVDPGYFEALGQPMVAGRAFTAEDLARDEPLLIVGESTARSLFQDPAPVGSRIRPVGSEEWYTVVGVVPDVPMSGLSASRDVLQVYRPRRSVGNGSTVIIRRDSGMQPRPLLGLIREVTRAADPDLQINFITEGRRLQRESLDREQFATSIMAVFATLALILAAVGLYGVVSQVVGQRTREIGIRMALGARRRSIASMVLRRAGGATAAGIAVGVALAVGSERVIESTVFDTEATGWTVFLLAGLALALTALLAAYAPARRATRVDPVEAMRVE